MSQDVDPARLWARLLDRLRQQSGSSTLEAYLYGATPVRVDQDALIVQVANSFSKEKLEKEFGSRIVNALNEERSNVRQVRYVVTETTGAIRRPVEVETPAAPVVVAEAESSSLNPEYTMARLIVGKSNAYPHALAQSVSLNPGKNYNPLYFYGGVGLGKTHLMQAIGHEILKHNPKARILYVSSEVLHNEYIETIQSKTWEKFRKKYRDLDCLLLDDVQFLEAGERIQEEFHHTFNVLHMARKQIVLTSDKKPQELQTEERLRSRYASGVVVDLQPPDRELREAILKFWSHEDNLDVPDEVLRYIAEKVPLSIRDLRGVYRTSVVKASVLGLSLSLSLVDEVLLTTVSPAKPREITIEMIQNEVCDQLGVSKEDLVGRRRERRVVVPRQVAMYLARELTGKPLTEIGAAFGKKDHTTVIHSCDKVRDEMASDSGLRDNVERLRIRIREKLGR